MSKKRRNGRALVRDMVMIAVGIVIAVILSKVGFIDFIVFSLRDYYILASFVAGIFFTSAFTLAPSSIALVHIAEQAPMPSVAIWGGLGAMFGDLLLFLYIRDRFADDLMNAMKPSTVKYILRSLHFGFLKWLSPILGAVIIASPLPDEFGVTLMGVSKIKVAVLMPVAFIGNVLGIYLLIQFASLL